MLLIFYLFFLFEFRDTRGGVGADGGSSRISFLESCDCGCIVVAKMLQITERVGSLFRGDISQMELNAFAVGLSFSFFFFNSFFSFWLSIKINIRLRDSETIEAYTHTDTVAGARIANNGILWSISIGPRQMHWPENNRGLRIFKSNALPNSHFHRPTHSIYIINFGVFRRPYSCSC